jgi:hypothetical protein
MAIPSKEMATGRSGPIHRVVLAGSFPDRMQAARQFCSCGLAAPRTHWVSNEHEPLRFRY